MLDVMYHGGKVALLGILPKGAGVDWDRIIFKGLVVHGIYGRKMYETWYKMTQLVRSGFPLQKALTHQIAIDDFQKITDAQLYDRMLSEFPLWLEKVKSMGILR